MRNKIVGNFRNAQCPFYIQKAVARILGKDLASIRCIQAATGGAFGGKEDYPSEPAACAALLARATSRPVKLCYDRSEDIAWAYEDPLPARADLKGRLAFYADRLEGLEAQTS